MKSNIIIYTNDDGKAKFAKKEVKKHEPNR
ncbi:Uncharacterised protein [Urinicoccus massiliensis]|uniref:Uncharacterized protein n=1 Tax=Urinicoccus massiliensis TaxID=1723382 RepID=A0A8H2M5L5_9FIRM|nr:Uncharacterised protein [Urinicoccus massiliensis]